MLAIRSTILAQIVTVDAVPQPTIDDAGIGNPCRPAAWAPNSPGPAFPLQSHLTPITPPAADFGRKGTPDILLPHPLRNVLQQAAVYVPFPRRDDIVRVDDEADQPMTRRDYLHLLLPKIDGILAEDME